MICFDFNTIFDTMQVKMGILDYFDKSFKADDNKLKAILIYPNQDKSIKISDKSLVKEIKTNQKDHRETITKTNEINTKSISNRYINVFCKSYKKKKHKKDFILKRAETMTAIILRLKKYVNGMEIIRGL